jgi:hypothetical protein
MQKTDVLDLPFLNPPDNKQLKNDVSSRVPFSDPSHELSTGKCKLFYPEWTRTELFDRKQ